MAYSERIKNFANSRDYLREFFVNGFKSRDEFDAKSGRSYDNERRRIESWLGDYMFFRQDATGKNIFLSVDSRTVPHNPLYQAFKAKTFTSGAITLHFYILDALADGGFYSIQDILSHIMTRYLALLPTDFMPDESTLRKKLKEYEELGLLQCRKEGRVLTYALVPDGIDLEKWEAAVAFFSETAPLGVVGCYLLDRLPEPPDCFRFKHRYILHALDAEVLLALLTCISEKRSATLQVRARSGEVYTATVYPLHMRVSVQNGRQYLLAHDASWGDFRFFRLDNICTVSPGAKVHDINTLQAALPSFTQHLWGVSAPKGAPLEHVEMVVHAGRREGFIVKRLHREKRCGKVEKLRRYTYRFTADVYDAQEMLPWIRTFTGRIISFTCSNPEVTARFEGDLAALQAMYGGEADALS